MSDKTGWIPCTPAGTPCFEHESQTKSEAWAKLMEAASHMPYKDKAAFIERGYTVEQFEYSNEGE